MGIELRDLSEGVVAAAMGVAGAIGEFFQLAKHRRIDGGPQGLFQLRQGGDFLRSQELAQVIGEEGRSSHNAIVPPFVGASKRNYSRIESARLAYTGGSNNAGYRLQMIRQSRISKREWHGILLEWRFNSCNYFCEFT